MYNLLYHFIQVDFIIPKRDTFNISNIFIGLVQIIYNFRHHTYYIIVFLQREWNFPPLDILNLKDTFILF